MQCRSDTGGYYDPRYVNPGLIGSITQSSGQNFNVWFPPSNMDHLKEIYGQMMLKHEAIFKYQVYELHRVYGRQKELMEEIRKREVFNHSLKPYSGLRSDYFWPSGGSLARNEPSGGSLSFLQPRPDQYPTRDVSSRSEPSSSCVNKSRKRVLDLELPASEYVDSDDENVVQVPDSKINSFSVSHSSCVNASGLFDLNSPAQPEEGADQCQHTSGQDSDRRNLPKVVDLNMLPADDECSQPEKPEILESKHGVDLNSCLTEECILIPSPPETARQSDLEAPVSPENKEGSPPRGESEVEGGLQEQEEDRVAADTLFVIASSGILGRQSKTRDIEKDEDFSDDSLVWFAGIATSRRWLTVEKGKRNSKPSEKTVLKSVWGKKNRRKMARVARSIADSGL